MKLLAIVFMLLLSIFALTANASPAKFLFPAGYDKDTKRCEKTKIHKRKTDPVQSTASASATSTYTPLTGLGGDQGTTSFIPTP